MLGLNFSVFRKRLLALFSPLDYTPTLWLDATNSESINKKNASSLTISGTNYLSSTDASLLFDTTDSFSVSTWIYKNDVGANTDFVFNVWDGRGYKLSFSTTGTLDFLLEGDGATGIITLNSTEIFAINTWHFVTFTYDGSKKASGVKLYGNGTLLTNNVTADTLTGTITPTQMWIGYDGATYSNIYLDNYNVYSRVITQSEVTALYNSDTGIDYENLGNITIPKYGAYLQGSNSQSLTSSSTDFDLDGTKTLSFVGWLKVPAKATNVGAVGRNEDFYNYNMIIQSNLLRVVTYTTSYEGLNSTISINDDTWYFYYYSINEVTKELQISVNNETIVIGNYTGTITLRNAGEFNIGRCNSLFQPAYHQNIGCYNRTLTQSEITELYNSGNGVQYTDLSTAQKVDLVSYYPLTETSGNRADSHGSNDLTDNNNVGYDEGKVGTQTISQITDLVSWYDMNEISGTRYDLHGTNDLTDNNSVGVALGKVLGVANNGDFVYSWSDLSGNSNDGLQVSGSNQPIYDSSGYITFDGVNDQLVLTKLQNLESTIFVVLKQISSTGQVFYNNEDGSKRTSLDLLASEGVGFVYTPDGGTTTYDEGLLTGSGSGVILVDATISQTVPSVNTYIDNVDVVDTGLALTVNGANQELVLSGRSGAPSSDAFQGNLYEILVYPTILTISQREVVRTYLNAKHTIY